MHELGVRSAQGYVFAPLLPSNSFLQLLEAIDPMSERTDTAASRGLVLHAEVA